MVSEDELTAVMPNLSAAKRKLYLPHLQAAMKEFDIRSLLREAHFLAQLAHESGEFRWMEEIWGPTTAQKKYEPPSAKAKQLGNTQPGDGKRFKGRGPIQLTGRANYKKFGDQLGVDLIGNPPLAATPEVGFRVAGLYWTSRNINSDADRDDIEAVTKKINGGLNGLADRKKYLAVAKLSLSINDEVEPDVTRVLVNDIELSGVRSYATEGTLFVSIKAIAKAAAWRILDTRGGFIRLQRTDSSTFSLPLIIRSGTGYVSFYEVPGATDFDAGDGIVELQV